jgi:hypothetical protein
MADFQIGDNLFSEDTGKYYNLNNGAKSYVKSPYETSQEKINQMYDAQRNGQLNTLKAQREKAIGGFNQQKKELTPQYAAQRNQADVVNSQNVTRLRELMAANGINMSGENVTAQANMNSSRQNSFMDINNNENQAMGAIDKQIANENDPSREQSINDSVESERSRSLTDAFSQAQQQAYQQQVDWRNYAMQKAQFDLEQKARELALQQAASAKAAAGRKASSTKSSTTGTQSQSAQDVIDEYLKGIQQDYYNKSTAASPKLDPEATTGIASQPGSYWYARGYGSKYDPVTQRGLR